jgi:urease accessory protein UreF
MDISTISPRRADRRTVDAVEQELPAGARARFAELRQRAMESEESAEMKRRLGERMVDLTEEYFAEEVTARRRRTAATAFAAGVAVGAVGMRLVSRR